MIAHAGTIRREGMIWCKGPIEHKGRMECEGTIRREAIIGQEGIGFFFGGGLIRMKKLTFVGRSDSLRQKVAKIVVK